jgi:radical SAM/Cys-rich protein
MKLSGGGAAISIISLLFWLPVTTHGAASHSSSAAFVSNNRKNHRSVLLFLKDNDAAASSMPDYGSTTVQVDQIKLTLEPKKKKFRRQDLFGSSIIDQTIKELEADVDFQETQTRIQSLGLEGVSKEERTQRRRALTNLGIPPFAKFLGQQQLVANTDNDADNDNDVDSNKPYHLERNAPKVLQINIGLYCNQACGHCHVESSPLRTEEMMTAETAAQCLQLLKQTPSLTTLDITGGAPELNAHFRYLVQMARSLRPDLDIIDRCNLTVLQEPGQETLVAFLKEQKVHIIASMPCYSEENVDTQRGAGVFERSIAALLALNDAGYGSGGNGNGNGNSALQLDLVYNPLGAFLPPAQDKLEIQYKEQLADNFGILFDQLFTITNMPIKRFADFLHRRGELEEYMDLLVRNFNKDTVPKLMCLETISVGWDGRVSTCTVFLYYYYSSDERTKERTCSWKLDLCTTVLVKIMSLDSDPISPISYYALFVCLFFSLCPFARSLGIP